MESKEAERTRSRARAVVCGVAVVKLMAHVATLGRYGYFRDELYYLACADHPAWGYVDHPPLSIAVLRLWRAAFGDAVETIRIVPALTGAAIVLLVGELVLDLGGGAGAALLATVAVLAAPARLGTDHYYSMNALDGLIWALAAWLVLRAVEAPTWRRWGALGIVLGLGLLNKWSVLWLGFGIAVGLVMTPARRVLRTPWPYVAFCLAAALAAPHAIWEMKHGWPTAEFARNAMALKYVRLPLGAFARQTVLMMNPAASILCAAGLVIPFTSDALRRARLFAWLFVTVVAIVALSKAKPEYLGPAFSPMLAVGAVGVEKALASRPAWLRGASATAIVAAMLGLAALALPFALPVLSVERFVAYENALGVRPQSSEKKELGRLPQFYADMFGWNELVDAAGAAYATLRPDEKPGAVVWAVWGGYGTAAAIDVIGAKRGLPHAIAGNNSYWLWGWGQADGRAVIVLGGSRNRLAQLFDELTEIGVVECGDCMPYENHKPVYVGRGMRRPFAEIWPELKHYE